MDVVVVVVVDVVVDEDVLEGAVWQRDGVRRKEKKTDKGDGRTEGERK